MSKSWRRRERTQREKPNPLWFVGIFIVYTLLQVALWWHGGAR